MQSSLKDRQFVSEMNRIKLQELIGDSVKPRDLKIYVEAFIHKSAYKDMGYSQERLEHLGDSVLALCVTHLLFRKYPNETEGTLTKMRTNIVNGNTLAYIGRQMKLDELVIFNKVASNVLSNDRTFEDTFEALIGAIYLDLGFEEAMKFVSDKIEKHFDSEMLLSDTNYKEILRKILNRHKMQAAQYVTDNNDGVFCCKLYCGGILFAESEGTSKKRAEMEAAHSTLLTHFPSEATSRFV